MERVEQLTASIGNTVTCHRRYDGKLLGIEASAVLDRLHYVSAGVVSYARGLNDTPKIAALLLLVPLLGGFGTMALVGIAIAVGGLISARRVAETTSQKITSMNHGQGFTANLITGLILIGASGFGLPVSARASRHDRKNPDRVGYHAAGRGDSRRRQLLGDPLVVRRRRD